MSIQIAAVIGIFAITMGFAAAYLGGIAGWVAVHKGWFKLVMSRRQWLYGCICLGFASGLGGGLVGADLATGRFAPWVSQNYDRIVDLAFRFV